MTELLYHLSSSSSFLLKRKGRKMNWCKSSAKKNKPIDYRMFHLTRSLSSKVICLLYRPVLFSWTLVLQKFIFLPFFFRRKKKKKDKLQNVQKFNQKEQALYCILAEKCMRKKLYWYSPAIKRTFHLCLTLTNIKDVMIHCRNLITKFDHERFC